MLARVAVAFAVLAVVLSGAAAGAAGWVPATPTGVDGAEPTGAGTPPEPDPATVVTINLTASGDARWTVASRFALANDSERRTFREFAAAVENGSVDAGYSVETFRGFVDRAATVTDRSGEMRVENPEWSHRVDNDTGVLALSFTWTNFAETDGNRVVLGDVFGTENDTWFPALGADQRLVVNAPPGYAVTQSAFAFSNGSISIDGPATIDTTKFPVVYAPIQTSTTPPPTSPATSPPTSDQPDEDDESGFPVAILGGALVLAAAILAGAYLIAQRDRPPAGATADGGVTEADSETDEAGGDHAAAGAEGPTSGGTTGPATDGADADDGSEADADDGDEDGDAGDDADDEELLSDEERVERLLRENGGRMKQANIVSETGWSNAKVSQLLSGMADDDRVEKLRIGRENLISLPDEDAGEID